MHCHFGSCFVVSALMQFLCFQFCSYARFLFIAEVFLCVSDSALWLATSMLLTLKIFFLKLPLSGSRGFLCLCINIIVVSASTLVHLVFGFGMEDVIALHPAEFCSRISGCFFLFCGNLSFFALLVKSSASCPG
jgi:hypothetical protein